MGEALIWDEDKTVFSQNLTKKSKYLDESLIRQIIRDSLKGLHYCKEKLKKHKIIVSTSKGDSS